MYDCDYRAAAILRVLKKSVDPSFRAICFPHGGGGVQSFSDWAAHLPNDVDLLCLDLPGRGKRADEPAFTSMDALVPMIIAELRDYADRPFVFFGHSMGALVAYEVARVMESAGGPAPFHVVVSGHKAADVPADDPPMYKYSDDELTDLVSALGMVPRQALENQELLANFIMPPLRADFEVAETYDRNLPAPLNAAITAIGGRGDDLLDAADLDQWHRLTHARFARIMFDGDHFFTMTNTSQVVSRLLREIDEVKADLPASVCFGDTVSYPALPLHERFRHRASLTPEATAVVSRTGNLTFQELDELSDALSGHLVANGQGPGARVGLLMDTSKEYAVALIGILKSGAAYVVLDAAQPPAALARILAKAGIDYVLTAQRYLPNIPSAWSGTRFVLDHGWERRLDASADTPAVAVDLDAPAQIVFSSGTTGEPKGIVCPHRSAVCSFEWRYRQLPYTEHEREAINIFLVWELMRPLLAGMPAFLIPDDVIYDPNLLVGYLEENLITRVLFTPSLLEVLVSSGSLVPGQSLSGLRVVYLNGEVVTGSLLARARQALPHVSFVNDYSIAETHDVAHLELSEISPAATQQAVPAGPPQHNVSVYVLDEARKPVARGFAGEIFVGGDAVGLGYLDNPELTQERFVPDTFRPGGTMFRTGDAGRMLHNGQLEIIGRFAFMVKIRGYSVVPGSVEAALLRHPNVQSAAIVVENDAKTGQPDRLAAHVVLRASNSGWQADLRAYLKEEIPDYAMPSKFVSLEKLPIAANGKLDRLRFQQADGEQRTDGAATLPPEDHVEHALRSAWQEFLTSDPGPTDDFFECGGHSLLAAQFCMRVKQSLKIELRVVEVFLNSNFEALVAFCRTRVEIAHNGQSHADRQLKQDLQPHPQTVVERERHASTDIAVIGMAARFPGARNVDEFWQNLCEGICSVSRLSREKLAAQGVSDELLDRPDYISVGAHLEDVECFDSSFWGLSEREATLMDPQHRLFLECCWQALEVAGYAPTHHDGRTGVFAGTFLPLYLLHHLNGAGLMDPTDAPLASLTEFGNDKDYLVSRVSYLLNLTGPSIAVQTSCSTGLVTIATAAQSLANGQCDMALAGASSIIFPQAGYQYVEGFINSSDGVCRAFDANANGTVLGDGVGVVVLKRLDDAIAAGDTVQAVIKGHAINNDGRSKASYSAPGAKGQTAVVQQALQHAGIKPSDVEYIETHGTGTKVGDPIEVRALADVFRPDTEGAKTCALGSVKPNIGHANIAAGVASFIKTVLSVRNGVIPATININSLNEDLGLQDTPFFVNERLRTWPQRDGHPRTAGVTSLGIGGTNCHVVLQEWCQTRAADWPGSVVRGSHALCLSAKTASALSRSCRNLAAFLRGNRQLDLGDVAHTLRVARCRFDYRTVVVASSSELAIRRLEDEAERIISTKPVAASPSVAFMLPGGGVQYPGMFKDLYDHASVFRDAFITCANASRPVLSRDLEKLVFGEDGVTGLASFEDINVMMYSAQYAMAQLLMACGVHPKALVGHSMSEYVVATLAGILTVEDAIGLMVIRGRAMAELGVKGAMLAAQCGRQEAEQILAENAWRDKAQAGEISIGVVNSNSSVVFTGTYDLVEALKETLEQAEIPCQVIDTAGVPSHSPLMAPARDLIDAHVRNLAKGVPQLDIALNAGGQWIRAHEHLPETYWSTQATGQIQFDRSLALLMEAEPAAVVDLGPSRNLSRFARQTLDEMTKSCVRPAIIAAARDRKDMEFTDRHILLECLGALWALGVDVDWSEASVQLEPPGTRRRVALPGYSFDKHRCWPDGHSDYANGKTVLRVVDGPRERRPGEAFTYSQTWTEALPPRAISSGVNLRKQRWLILADRGADGLQGDQNELAEFVSLILQEQGHDVVRVCRRMKSAATPKRVQGATVFIDPDRNGLKALFEAELETENPADRVLCLWQLGGDDAASSDPGALSAERMQRNTAVFDLARVLCECSFQSQLDLWIVGDRMVQIDDEDAHPDKACALGAAIVLPQENPMVRCRVIDVKPGCVSSVSRQLTAEIGRETPGRDALIAFRGARRWIPHYPELALAEPRLGEQAIRPDGVYLVTGGLGRIGLSLTEHLAGRGARIVVTTRRAVPDRTKWTDAATQEPWMKRLAALDAAPGKVLLRQADVSDLESTSDVLDEMVREFGRVDGIFHAAGLAELKFLPELDETTLTREFASKVVGTCNLYKAIERLQHNHAQVPEFVFLFSSLASILGGPAMAGYAAANRFMDAFARRVPNQLGVRWINSNWDDWAYDYEFQVTAAYQSSHARELALSPQEGIAIIERILATIDNGQVIVATRALPARLREWVDQAASGQSSPPGGKERPASAEPAEPGANAPNKEDISNVFLSEVKALLKVSEITWRDNFFDIGGDSLLATALQMRLKNNGNWRPPRLEEIFKSSTFEDLFEKISNS